MAFRQQTGDDCSRREAYNKSKFEAARNRLREDGFANSSRRCDLSDFHEMANNLRMINERALNPEDPAYMIDQGGRRLGPERRQFSYSHYFPERRAGAERRSLPERRTAENHAA